MTSAGSSIGFSALMLAAGVGIPIMAALNASLGGPNKAASDAACIQDGQRLLVTR